MKSQPNPVTMKHHRRPDTAWRAAYRGVLPIAAAIVGFCHPTTTAQNLIQNGSFEDPVVPGDYAGHTTGQTIGGSWLVEHADVDVGVVRTYGVGSAFYPTPAGDQFCYLADNVTYSVLSHEIATSLTAGVTYELTFLQSAFLPSFYHTAGHVAVELGPTGGLPELSPTLVIGEDEVGWKEQRLAFIPATSGPYTLRFSSVPFHPGNIDDVRLVEVVVPEPAAGGLAAGLGLLGLAGWRGWGGGKRHPRSTESVWMAIRSEQVR